MLKNNLANRTCKKSNSFSLITPIKKYLFFLYTLGFIIFTDKIFAQSFPLGSLPNITFPTQISRTSTTSSSAANNSARTIIQSGSERNVSDSIKSARVAAAPAIIIDSASLNIRKKLYGFNIFNNPNKPRCSFLTVSLNVCVDRATYDYSSLFAKIYCVPQALVTGARHVMVVKPVSSQIPPRPEVKLPEPVRKKGVAK